MVLYQLVRTMNGEWLVVTILCYLWFAIVNYISKPGIINCEVVDNHLVSTVALIISHLYKHDQPWLTTMNHYKSLSTISNKH